MSNTSEVMHENNSDEERHKYTIHIFQLALPRTAKRFTSQRDMTIVR